VPAAARFTLTSFGKRRRTTKFDFSFSRVKTAPHEMFRAAPFCFKGLTQIEKIVSSVNENVRESKQAFLSNAPHRLRKL
jgi:hypothetical protein